MLTPSPQLIRLALPDGLPPAVYLSSFGCVALRVALSHLPQAPARFGALFKFLRPDSAFAIPFVSSHMAC
jgi:hypothetical protein